MDFKGLIEKYTEDINIKLSEHVFVGSENYSRLQKAMVYSLFSGGKRIRPLLTIGCCRLLKGNYQASLNLACAVECIHTASLIHDDMPCMDDSPLRRGIKTCHKEFDQATALLAGTSLYYKALEYVSYATSEMDNSDLACDACRDIGYYAGEKGMMGGQQIDIDYKGKEITKDLLHELDSLKTAALIKLSCRFGGYAGYADLGELSLLTSFGEYLGSAFQISDDILDCEANEEQLGKPVGKDADENKTNNATFYGIERAKDKKNKMVEKALRVLDEFDDYGGKIKKESAFLKEFTKTISNRKK